MLSSDLDQSWTWLLKQDTCKIFIINMKHIELSDFDNAKNNMLESGQALQADTRMKIF